MILSLTIIGSFIGKLLGGYDMLLITLIIFVVMDYLTGVMKAIIEKKLSSSVGFKGIFKKILIFFLIVISVRIDLMLNDIGIRYVVIMFYLINEAISILENAGKMGLPLPPKLNEILESLKQKN